MACHSFGVFRGKAPPSGSCKPYFHTTLERTLQGKLLDEAVLGGATNVVGNQNTNWLLQWDIQFKEWSKKQDRVQLLGGGKRSALEFLPYKIL